MHESVKKPQDTREKIIGLGEDSMRKSYYPQLQQNIEDLKEAKQKAEESDQLKSAFLANMSHEIRTPMNAIIGFTELIEKDLDEVTFDKYKLLITNAGNRLLTIINDILDISLIDSDQLKIKKEHFILDDLLNEAIAIHQNDPRFVNRGILEFRVRQHQELKGLLIFSDQTRIYQILHNLLHNASKFTQRGFIEIGVNRLKKDGKPYIEFYIQDTGTGIAPEISQTIFERFTKSDPSTPKEGFGLGLSISKGIVELLGGDMWFLTNLGVGTTFYFTIPIENK